MRELHEQIEYLIRQGFHVHACCPPEHHEIDPDCKEGASGKIPYSLDKGCHLSGWESAPGFTIEQLERIWKIKPTPNVGLKLGNGIVRLDIDSDRGEGHIREKGLPLPPSWEFTSGRGRGILYRTPPTVTCKKKTPYENVELLGDGQQTVIPPSRHRRGTIYQWEEGHAPTETPLADAPDWILNLMESVSGRATASNAPRRNSASRFWSLTIEDVLGLHQGNFPSPFHDSGGGVNSSIGEGVHHCWRHDVCHSPLQALAVWAGIMGADGNEACFRAGAGHHGTKESEVEFTRENIESMWEFAKAEKILLENDPHPFEESRTPRMPGYRPPADYFEEILHPRSGQPPTLRFVPGRFVKDVLDNEHFIIRLEEGKRGRLHRAADGYYKNDGEAFVLRKLHDVLGENQYPNVTRMQRLEILDSVRGAAFKYDEEIKDDTDWIPLKNGVINWHTQEFRAYDLERDFFFFQVPVEYDSSATCPVIDKALSDVFDEDGVRAILDYLRECLVRIPMKDHLIAYGPPHTTKTTLTGLISAFLGKDSVANCPMQKIARDKFAPSDLENKMANVYNDIGKGAIYELGQINSATGMDTIRWEKKGIDGHGGFQPYAKHLFFTNELPRLDTQIIGRSWEVMAFFERFKVVLMQKSVFVDNPRPGTNEKKRDRGILKKLTSPSELSGLLNRVLSEISYVVEHGLRAPLNAKDSMMTYFRESNPAQAFLLECLEFDGTSEITKAAIRTAIQHYTDGLELDRPSDKAIKGVFEKAGIQAYYDEKWVKPRTHWWVGIKLREDFLKDLDEAEARVIAGGNREIKNRPPKPGAGEEPQLSPGKNDVSGSKPANLAPASPGLFDYLHVENAKNDVYNKESEKAGEVGAEGAGRDPTFSFNLGGTLGQSQKQTFNEELGDLQRKACIGNYEHEVVILKRSIYLVAELKGDGDRVSAFSLRKDLSAEFPKHPDTACRLVDGYYAEIVELGSLLNQIRKSEGQP